MKDKPDSRVWIIARDIFEADAFATRADIARGQYVLLQRPEQVHGHHGLRVAIAHPLRSRRAHNALLAALAGRVGLMIRNDQFRFL